MADTNNISYVASVLDGKITSSYSQVNKQTGKIDKNEPSTVAGGELNKEAFLQLLVAQMQYQDPLEPTDNTEYISQLANFSSLEQMQNMNESMKNMSMASDLQRAANLVGQFATIREGEQNIVTGKVDSVEYKDGTAYVSIGGKSYELSKVAEQIDQEYLTASALSTSITEALKGLPEIETITDVYEDKIAAIRTVYDGLDTYQKSFVSQTDLATLKAYEEKLAEVKASYEADNAEDASEDAKESVEDKVEEAANEA